jgi:Zinc dependent phospholipase C
LKVPVEAIHLSAFLDSLAQSRARDALGADELRAIGRLGALVIDFPYFDRFPIGVLRHFLKLPTAVSDWGEALHHGRPVLVAKSMLEQARALRASEATGAEGARVLALALGFASHLAVDAALHPLVNRLARARAARLHDHPLRQHTEVEKFHSVLFHEARLGFDFMGRRELRDHIEVPAHALHRDAALRTAFSAGIATALERTPSPSLLRRWASGYVQYVWLVSSPAGKTLMPERVKHEVREEVFSGAWGSFDQAYAHAVERSRATIDAAFDFALDAAHETAFDALAPPGAIDDMDAREGRRLSA